MKKHWKRWLSLLSLMLLVLLAWLLWPDRRMAQAKALQKELTGPNGKSLSAEQRKQKWQQYRKLTEKMTAAQRDQLSAESRKRRAQEMAKYFSMSQSEKNRYLDERIRASESRRQQMQSKGGQGGTGGQRSGSNGGPGQGQSNGQGTNGGRDRSPESRDHARQDRLDSTSPAERAMFSQFMKDLNARRSQLGLGPARPGFGPPR
jgi:hypothetical protein